MKLRDTRLWVLVIALAFLVLWVVSVGVVYAAPAQEPLPVSVESDSIPSPGLQAIGVAAWCLVGLGFLSVIAAVILSSRPKRRRAIRSRRAFRLSRSLPAPRFRGNVERRYR